MLILIITIHHTPVKSKAGSKAHWQVWQQVIIHLKQVRLLVMGAIHIEIHFWWKGLSITSTDRHHYSSRSLKWLREEVKLHAVWHLLLSGTPFSSELWLQFSGCSAYTSCCSDSYKGRRRDPSGRLVLGLYLVLFTWLEVTFEWRR